MGITMVITMVLNPISWDVTYPLIMCVTALPSSKQGKYGHVPAPPSATRHASPVGGSQGVMKS